MILIDSIFINNSGGKVLLDYLVQELEKNKMNPFYLFDDRCINSYKDVPAERKRFLKGSLIERNRFYRENKYKFTRVLCFGNVPPSVRLKASVLTYLHQRLYLERPAELRLSERIKLALKERLIKFYGRNTDYWGVQSDNLSQLMKNRWGVTDTSIKIWPFYPPLSNNGSIPRNPEKYLYVSAGDLYKNHFRLIEAFSAFNSINESAELHLTVPERFTEVSRLIESKQQEGIRIINHGFLPRKELGELYSSARFLVFPSLAESFGLGLVEAIDMGCDVIAADLPYVHAVCRPGLVFDPLSTKSIEDALHKSKSDWLAPSIKKVNNQIGSILSFLSV